jgi:DNA-binding CsgD family transcriptional regulator
VLVERNETIARLDELLTESTHGKGVVAVISGPTAMGKTAMLHALAEKAANGGSRILGAVSSRDERKLPYGVLGQLFHGVDPGPPGAGRSAATRPPGAGANLTPPTVTGTLLAVAREVHRIVGELARRRHLLITVDDIQHADIASLWCLRYLAQRLGSLPLTLVFTRGAPLDERPPPILHDLLYRPSVRRFHLDPLSVEGVARLAGARTACVHSTQLVPEVHALSAGNPILVQALLEEHRFCAEPATPATSAAEPDSASVPVGALPTGHIFHEAVLTCLHRLGPSAVRLARGIALLGDAASPLLLSRLSGIDAELVERFVRLLTTIGVLDGPRLRRPAVSAAILEEMPLGAGTELRHRAARLLHEEGAAATSVAAHLLNAGPLREDWVLPVLRAAVREGLADGDVPRAVRCLELAAECCSDDAQRAQVRAQLAVIQWQLRPALSGGHFRSLKPAVLDGRLTGADALLTAQGMLFNLDFGDAVEVIDRLNVEATDESDVGAELRGTQLVMTTEFPGLLDCPNRPPPATAASVTSTTELRAGYALSIVLRRGADDYALALAEQVLQSSEIRPPLMIRGYLAALMSLVYADRLDAAADWCDRLSHEISAHDAPAWQAMIATTAALVALRRGHLTEAVEQAEAAFDRVFDQRWNVTAAQAVAIMVEAHTAMGDHQAATRHLAAEVPPALFLTRAGLHYLYARGRHHLATDNKYMALSDFMECGNLTQRWGIDTPALVPWRLGAAEAWRRLDNREEATQLIEEQLARSDTGLARSRGMVLHGLASVRPVGARPTILHEALTLLESSGARYDAAGVLADLSAAYQELGEKAKARTTARRAWRIAKSCHAEALCQTLLPTYSPGSTGPTNGAAAGGHEGYTTFAKLSDSERRVAVLAAQGYTNREIADKLFITVSTVEQHLTRVYRKMDIRNREQLLAGARIDNSEAV